MGVPKSTEMTIRDLLQQELVLKVLGFGDDEISRVLDSLYPALAKEIGQLKTLMQG